MDYTRISVHKSFGQSMMPLLHDGDIVHLKKKDFSKISINDIICVRMTRGIRTASGPHPNLLLQGEGEFFTHRVIYKTQKYIITRGDNNLLSDGKIYPKNIIGTVNKIQRESNIFDINDLYLMQSTLYFREIVKVKKALEKEKIDYVILKGLPIHLFYEGEHPKRLYADCDLLISKSKYQKAKKILNDLGYLEYDTSYSVVQKKLKKGETEVSFFKNINGAVVTFDIHLEAVFLMTQISNTNALYPRRLVDKFSEMLIGDVRSVRIFEERVNILSAEYLFVYLCLHLYHHNFQGTYRYDLIVKIIKIEKLDYKKIASIINEFKLNNLVYPVLLLFIKYYDVKFDKAFLSSIKPSSEIMSIFKGHASNVNIFNNESRVASGITRFRMLFQISPNRLRRYGIFINPQVIFFVIWITVNRLGLLRRPASRDFSQ
ncbi:MAG TPA: nucleotidyltransferase family protein [Patescibacteria group bacterium]|nr:nucleotidyltransferase family protein [Patescibacteria group bacterium]